MASAPPTSTLLAGLDWLAAHRDLIADRFFVAHVDSSVRIQGEDVADVAADLGLPFERSQELGVNWTHHIFQGRNDGVWVRLVSVERAS